MNARKFLVLKLAETAAAIAQSATHVADNHTGDCPDHNVCVEEMVDFAIILGETLKIAQQNGVFKRPDLERVKVLRDGTKRELANESLQEALRGNLSGMIII